jgi:hypothetical protein
MRNEEMRNEELRMRNWKGKAMFKMDLLKK